MENQRNGKAGVHGESGERPARTYTYTMNEKQILLMHDALSAKIVLEMSTVVKKESMGQSGAQSRRIIEDALKMLRQVSTLYAEVNKKQATGDADDKGEQTTGDADDKGNQTTGDADDKGNQTTGGDDYKDKQAEGGAGTTGLTGVGADGATSEEGGAQ